MKIKAVVFNLETTPLQVAKKEDLPDSWFRDRQVIVIQIQDSLPPPGVSRTYLPEVGMCNYLNELHIHPGRTLIVSDCPAVLTFYQDRGHPVLAVTTDDNPFCNIKHHCPPEMDRVINHIKLLEYQLPNEV